jgi:hypothetical protein
MPLIVNGVEISQNVANALMVNGVSVTQVIANGVAVWTQNLINLTSWSGNSIYWGNNTYRWGWYWGWSQTHGIETSGLSFRRWWNNGTVSPWATISSTTGVITGGGYANWWWYWNNRTPLWVSGTSFSFGNGWMTLDPYSKSFSGQTTDGWYGWGWDGWYWNGYWGWGKEGVYVAGRGIYYNNGWGECPVIYIN